MDPLIIGIVAFGIVLLLIFLGIPIGAVLLIVGTVGLILIEGVNYAETQLVMNFWSQGTKFIFTALPLYILMGHLIFFSRLAGDLFDSMYRWVGRLPGGLAVASVFASAGFGAISGGSASSVATLGPMCMPEMRKFNYNGSLAAGSIAAAGTLGILIPPSVFLLMYGIWTETSIGALFIAGIVPGIITAIVYSGVIITMCLLNPGLGPIGETFTWRERFLSLTKLSPIIGIFVIIVGGIYIGVFDPVEAGAFGVVGVIIFAASTRRLSRTVILDSLRATTGTSLMIFFVIFGGHLISRFVVLTGMTSNLVQWIVGMELSPYALILALTLMYIVLGMMLDIWAMLLLTIPFVVPAAIAAGLDPIWFGVYVVVMCELAAITPPVGLNVYIMARSAPEVSVGQIFKGVMPFFFGSLAVVVLITIFPDIVLWLPKMAF